MELIGEILDATRFIHGDSPVAAILILVLWYQTRRLNKAEERIEKLQSLNEERLADARKEISELTNQMIRSRDRA